MPKPSESIKDRSYETTKTGTLMRMLGEPYAYPIHTRMLMEEELNARFAQTDRKYFNDVRQMREADLRERRGGYR